MSDNIYFGNGAQRPSNGSAGERKPSGYNPAPSKSSVARSNPGAQAPNPFDDDFNTFGDFGDTAPSKPSANTYQRASQPAAAYSRPAARKNTAPARSAPARESEYTEPLSPSQPAKKSSGSGKPPKKRKKHVVLKTVLILLLVIILAIPAGGFYVYKNLFDDYECETLEDNAYVNESTLIQSAAVSNILLMGIDNMDTSVEGRSDAMILLSIDSKHSTLKLTSFMRDSYVEIPGHGWAKLNASCTYGGPQLVVDTIEYNFGIKIDAYIKIGYELLIELVDSLGGITVPEVDDVESLALSLADVQIAPGVNVEMDGFQALTYCRIRHGQSDFYRTERQREMLSLIVAKVKKTNPAKLISIANDLIKKVECSISKTELMKYALSGVKCLSKDIEQARVPADDTWYNDTKNSQAVLVVDFAANTEYINNFIYGDGEQK